MEDEDRAEEGTDEDSSEMIDRLVREMKSNRQTLAPLRGQTREQEERNRELIERADAKADAEPRAEEHEEEEPDTEHKEVGNERNEQETFGIEREIEEEIRN
jgi:hypothetical protein